MKRTAIQTLAAVACLISTSFSADIAVFPAYVTNMTEAQGQAIGAVMAQVYGQISGKDVVGPPHTEAMVPMDVLAMSESAKALGATEFVIINAVALKDRILVEGLLYATNGTIVHRANMTAVTLDDMTEVCDRMARALINKTTTDATIEIENVTRRETEEKNKLFVDKIIGVKTSMLYSVYGDDYAPMMSIGYHMKLEGDKYFIEFGASPLVPTDMFDNSYSYSYGGIAFDMGASYYLTQNRNISPYVGGGLSPRVLFEPGTMGVAPYAQVGIMLMRNSSTRIWAALRIAQNALPITFPEEEVWENGAYDPSLGYYKDNYSVRPEKSFYPTEVSLDIGIGW